MSLADNRIYLVGFMGSGKSTVGKKLADKLRCTFHDLDEIIEEERNKTIPEIFSEEGEEEFRDIETLCLREKSRQDPPFVLATGGGVPEKQLNRNILKNTGIVVYLNVDFETLFERIEGSENRPLVPGDEDAYSVLKKLWEERVPLYEAVSTVQIEANDRTPMHLAEAIISNLDI